MTMKQKSKPVVKFGHFGTLAHGPALDNKCKSSDDVGLLKVLADYKIFVNLAKQISFDLNDVNSSKTAINQLTELLNNYRATALPVLEARDNSGQENLRSSIVEEFFQLLLYPLIEEVRKNHEAALALGKANSYVSLTFTPKSFISLFEKPTPSVHTKDQDFVLGCAVQLVSRIKSSDKKKQIASESIMNVVVPVVAIECKTYIERNMLDSCAGTAKRLKSAMPYCLYLVVAEYMKMDDAYPELTDIDEIFILTRASNSDRLRTRTQGLVTHNIGADLVYEIFKLVQCHLNKIWWSPEEALKRGRIIGRP